MRAVLRCLGFQRVELRSCEEVGEHAMESMDLGPGRAVELVAAEGELIALLDRELDRVVAFE